MKEEERKKREKERSSKASIIPAREVSCRTSLFNRSQNSQSVTLFLVLISLCLALTSCGYGFTHAGGIVPPGAKNIAIQTFVNNTNEPYVDIEVTKAVANEFVVDGRLSVVNTESADLVLKGRVAKFEMIPLSYDVNSYVQQYRINIVVDITLEDVKAQKIILQDKGLSSVFVASYAVTIGDIKSTKIAKQSAVIKASQDVALTVRSRVLEGF